MEQGVDGSLRMLLRARLRNHHDAVEAAFDCFDLQTREGLRLFLVSHLSVLRALSPLFSPHDPYAVHPPRLIDAILSDLRALDSDDCSLELCPPQSIELHGASYVLLGSHLGARVLSDRVATSIDPIVSGATRYLSATDRREAWRRLTYVMSEPEKTWDKEEIVTSAAATFSLFTEAAKLARILYVCA